MVSQAVYSSVPVYEMTVNNIAVMKRRKDGWVNATQILKVAGVDKGKRTKLLEKEILTGEHEKVQGGYGKYQGTWISFENGVQFCKRYGVHDLLAPLLYFDENAQGLDSTPTKEQAMAARRKQMYSSTSNLSNGTSAGGFPQISSTIAQALASVVKTKPDSPSLSRQSSRTMHMSPSLKRTVTGDSDVSAFMSGAPSRLSQESSFNLTQPDSTYSSQQMIPASQESMEPPRKRLRPSPPVEEIVRSSVPSSQEMPNSSQQTVIHHGQQEDEQELEARQQSSRALPPLNIDDFENAEHVQHLLMNLFVDTSEALATLDHIPGQYIDLPIDQTGSAAIHWAASLAIVPLLKGLIDKGASIFRINNAGETALMRGCFVTNNFDNSTFPQLLSLLHPTIPIADSCGRTILHHIAVKSGMKGRSQDSRYYLECLLEFIVRNPATSSSPPSSAGTDLEPIGFARFLSEVVNVRDSNGDTALNIAARIGNKDIIQQLLDIGADSNIPNRAGLRPTDFGIGGVPQLGEGGRDAERRLVPEGVVEKSRDIVVSMQDLISSIDSDFQTELQQKQSQIEQTLSSLREASARCSEATQRLDRLRELKEKHARLTQYRSTLNRELDHEHRKLQKSPLPASSTPPTLRPGSPLPHARTLASWVAAYRGNAEGLKSMIGNLQLRSTELEEKYRRVVAICTDVDVEQVDSLLEGLVQAVESDPGEVDTRRVRSFLRKVEEGG